MGKERRDPENTIEANRKTALSLLISNELRPMGSIAAATNKANFATEAQPAEAGEAGRGLLDRCVDNLTRGR